MSYVVYGIIVSLVILILYSLYVGSKNNDETITEDEEKVDEVYEYTSKQGGKRKTPNKADERKDIDKYEEEFDESFGENHDYDLSEVEPTDIDKSNIAPPYSDLFNGEDIKASKKVAKQFIKIFYNLNGRYPLKYIDESQKYMSEELYNKLQHEHEAGNMAKMYREYESADIFEPTGTKPSSNDGVIVWVANVKGTVLDYHKENKKEVQDIYIIYLEKIDDEYKVIEYSVNVPF